MSLLWYFVRDDNKTVFELNRGDWYEHFAPWNLCYGMPINLHAKLLKVSDLGTPLFDGLAAAWLGANLVAWAETKAIRLINDAGDEMDEISGNATPYLVAGSRFPQDYAADGKTFTKDKAL